MTNILTHKWRSIYASIQSIFKTIFAYKFSMYIENLKWTKYSFISSVMGDRIESTHITFGTVEQFDFAI